MGRAAAAAVIAGQQLEGIGEKNWQESVDSRLHYAILLEGLVLRGFLVPVKGLEPSWGHPRLILSQLRIPFRHTGSSGLVYPSPAGVHRGAGERGRNSVELSVSAGCWLYCEGLTGTGAIALWQRCRTCGCW